MLHELQFFLNLLCFKVKLLKDSVDERKINLQDDEIEGNLLNGCKQDILYILATLFSTWKDQKTNLKNF